MIITLFRLFSLLNTKNYASEGGNRPIFNELIIISTINESNIFDVL